MRVGAFLLGLLLTVTATAATPSSSWAHTDAPAEPIWFPVQTPVDSFVDSWGDPRSGGRSHEGTDILAPQMHGVFASADGEVIKAKGEDCAPGTFCESFYLAVAGDDGRGYFYVHLNNDAPGRPDGCDQRAGYEGAFSSRLVDELEARGTLQGVRVERGELIGYVGSSGNAACGSDQLHYEIWNDHDWGSTGKSNPYGELRNAHDAGRTWGPDGIAPDPDPIERDAGPDRHTTAVELSRVAFDDAETVFVAPDDSSAEALVAAPLAGLTGAPVLLVNDDVEHLEPVAEEIRRLGATNLVVVGNESEVPDTIVDQLITDTDMDPGQVRRLQGDTVADLSVVVAREILASSEEQARPLIAVGQHPVPGRDWPDALAAGQLAISTGQPILLTPHDELAPALTELLGEFAVTDAIVVGGPEAVTPNVEESLQEDLGIAVERLAGATRYETSLALAERVLSADDRSTEELHVATGANFPDALAAAPSITARGAVMVLTNGTSRSPDALLDWLRERADSIDRIHVIGGVDAVTDTVANTIGQHAAWPR